MRVMVLVLAILVLSPGAAAQFVNGARITDTKPPLLGFLDITTTGIPVLNAADDSEHFVQFPPNAIKNPFFASNGSVLISSNGVVIMGLTAGNVSGFNDNILPGFGVPPGLPAGGEHYFCVYWDDLFPMPNFANSTIYYQLLPGSLIIMWKNITHFSLQNALLTITFEIQIFDTDIFPDCNREVQYLYEDTSFNPPDVQINNGASATVGLVSVFRNAGLTFNNATITPAKVFSLSSGTTGTLVPDSPFGPGSLRLQFSAACAPDFRLLAVTFNHGLFPNGWLFGVDIPINELAHELSIGPPYTGAGGAFTLGPFGGLPSGLTFYSVVLGIADGVLLGGSNAITYTIP
jgi:hypothetical protein